MRSPEMLEEIAQLRRMRFASLLEGSTLMILIGIAVPLKYLEGLSVATSIVGPIHGMAFIFYFWMLIQTVSDEKWALNDVIRMIVAALIPFGTFVNERALARRQALLLETTQ